jgi:GR25 family glycosyltransferase involved in LPS biosynthesis
MDSQIQILVITLGGERQSLIQQQFLDLRIPFKLNFLDASCPGNTSTFFEDDEDIKDRRNACCSLSHLRALSRAAELKTECQTVVILEDDVALYWNFSTKVTELAEKYFSCPTDSALYIGWIPQKKLSTYFENIPNLRSAFETVKIVNYTAMWGTQGYMIHVNHASAFTAVVKSTLKETVAAVNEHLLPCQKITSVGNFVADAFLHFLLNGRACLPMLMKEQDTPSTLGHFYNPSIWYNNCTKEFPEFPSLFWPKCIQNTTHQQKRNEIPGVQNDLTGI